MKPPAAIERLVTAPRQNNVSLTNQSPNRKYFLKLQSEGLPSVQTFGKPHYYFAGLQVDFKANRARVADDARIRRASRSSTRPPASHATIETPKGASVSSPQWSPDGIEARLHRELRRRVAPLRRRPRDRQVAAGVAAPLLATFVTTVDWTADGSQLVTVLVPDARKAEPKRPAIETGPLVRLTDEKKEKTRNFASLLRDPYEKELMEYYVTGQLAMINVSSGAVKKIGAPGMISAVDASPDGKYFHVTLMQKPFSYIVQYNSFGTSEQIWDADGKMLTEVANRPLREVTSGDDDFFGPPGAGAERQRLPRNVGWMPNGQGIYFLQQDPAPPRAVLARAADTTDSSAAVAARAARVARTICTSGRRRSTRRRERSCSRATTASAACCSRTMARRVFVAENANGTGHVYAVYFDEPGKKLHDLARARPQRERRRRRPRVRRRRWRRGGNGADSVTFYQNPGTIVAKRGRNGGQVAHASRPTASTRSSRARGTSRRGRTRRRTASWTRSRSRPGRSRACSRARPTCTRR